MIVIVLVVILGIFAAASMMQSYASARQAEAQIATAHAAQISATGNLISITSNLILLLAVIILVSTVLYYFYKKSKRVQRPVQTMQDFGSMPGVQNSSEPQLNMRHMKELLEMQMMMAILKQLNAPQDRSSPVDQHLLEDELRRLR